MKAFVPIFGVYSDPVRAQVVSGTPGNLLRNNACNAERSEASAVSYLKTKSESFASLRMTTSEGSFIHLLDSQPAVTLPPSALPRSYVAPSAP
jgi:hypothetical protein